MNVDLNMSKNKSKYILTIIPSKNLNMASKNPKHEELIKK